MKLGILMLDSDRRVLVANVAAVSMLGLASHEPLVGRRIEQLIERSADPGYMNEIGLERLLRAFGCGAACRESLDCDLAARDSTESSWLCAQHKEILIETPTGRFLDFTLQLMGNARYLLLVEDVSETRNAEADARRLANFDGLTALPNRKSFLESVERVLTEVEAMSENAALLLLDLDYFKQINDSMGHGAGDELLREVAARLVSTVAEAGLVARLGGDEFAILQSDVSRSRDILKLVESIGECFRAPFHLAGQQIRIGASIGIARSPRDAVDKEALLRNAETALYRAKASGRNTWRFFKPSMYAEIVARAELEQDLRRAVAEHMMEAYFQPILHAHGDKVSAFEALLRWRHPERGMVSPAEFIPVAEEMGLIVELGAQVLEQACQACATWPEEIRIAVNLSAIQFKRGDIVNTIQQALSMAGLAPSRLEVEITESVMMCDADRVCDVLKKLRDMGVGISLDDFGTGYSSLSYLHRFPFDRVKIDGSFLRKACDDPHSLILLQGMIRLCVDLKLGLVIEGVETPDQLRLVRDECRTAEVQGFLFSPAVPPSEVAKLLSWLPIEKAA